MPILTVANVLPTVELLHEPDPVPGVQRREHKDLLQLRVDKAIVAEQYPAVRPHPDQHLKPADRIVEQPVEHHQRGRGAEGRAPPGQQHARVLASESPGTRAAGIAGTSSVTLPATVDAPLCES